MSIWTWFVFILGIYAGTYIPKQWRINFEVGLTNLLRHKQKPKAVAVQATVPGGVT